MAARSEDTQEQILEDVQNLLEHHGLSRAHQKEMSKWFFLRGGLDGLLRKRHTEVDAIDEILATAAATHRKLHTAFDPGACLWKPEDAASDCSAAHPSIQKFVIFCQQLHSERTRLEDERWTPDPDMPEANRQQVLVTLLKVAHAEDERRESHEQIIASGGNLERTGSVFMGAPVLLSSRSRIWRF